ncbi:DUF2207 domain-containing protein [Leptotrichia buccalis]|uniref:DUF2207 domain-containing protein n=1 Tax=Leptotrichia buccalis (strain ATCC 14201 / DSM 1135 / JCM 12969 / NCTC 10249 / C-1013-b) TaxID=523794 RepID=C7NEK8_LEPBD|nr:DUF2207 domain-containing protein [Leptotrichia buccalis]ACV38369.1 hypothetical protein Lebu_0458 [Leptotrichia buccalis C-1013-b]
MNKFYVIIIEITVVVLAGIYSILTWHFFGRDPKRKAIVPEFTESDYISAMFVAYINGERDSKEILKLGVLSLMLKGYISEVAENGTGNRKYVLNLKNRDNLRLRRETLFEEENNLLDVLSENELFENKLGIIRYKNRIVYFLEKKYKRIIYKNNYIFFIPIIFGIGVSIVFILLELLQGNLESAIIGTMFIFIWLEYVHGMSRGILKFLYTIVMLGIIVAVMVYMEIYLGLNLFILGIMFLIYEKVIGKYTVSGQRKMEYIEGLKMYFETAEKNRMDKFETEEEKINYFTQIYPYVIALKMKDKKIGIFKDSLDFVNTMGSYADAQYYVNEYIEAQFPILRKRHIFW